MTAAEIVQELKTLGSASIKKVLLKHGIEEPLLGVKIEELKKTQKRIKKDYQLALDLYDTGIYDAMISRVAGRGWSSGRSATTVSNAGGEFR